MNKTTIVIGGIVVVGVLVVLIFWLAGSGTETTNTAVTPSTAFPIASSTPQTNTITVSTQTPQGGVPIQTTDFLADPTTLKDPVNTGYYYLGYHVSEGTPDPTATDNPPYIITYISATHYFNIALLQEPIGAVRAEAEQYLMNRLGIPQSQMCQLDYMVSVPDRVNSQFSGISLGFSFCPGATVLPK
ncbi:MAG: hypothetical protein ACYCZZ_01270 [Minisyncoccota bacterium]